MVSEYVPTFNRLFREATALRQFLENDDVHLLHPSDLSSQRLLRVSPETIGRLESLEQVSIDLAKVQDILRVSQSCIRLRIAQVKSSLTPVNLIPVEIMRQMFSNCITAVDDSKAVRSTVMALSQVSTRWREIAIGHSSLWSLLDLSWSDSLISLWRSRAGSQRRLDVVMHSLDDQKSITPANTTSKWRSLHYEFLAMGHDTPKLFHSPLFDDRLHGLEMLNLAPNGGDWGIGSTCFGHKLPHLHTLRLMGQFHIEFNYASLGKQLVNLTVSRLDYQQLKEVCWSCIRLERLCISVWRYSPSSKDKTVVMPKTLRNLIIMNTEAYILDRLFEDISAPDLTKLSVYLPKVEHFSRRYDISIQLMESFVSRKEFKAMSLVETDVILLW
ncbi:uncharacterized protein EI90DRAFT_370323 [Cantharellus anzutake]|uniref:uncharacterized protein n=1 Tax=Cantharellus anzutake TaxID=1750568 RepID=UPI00190659C1|nr:uncharacterized protein EI90DRAFT_370323 [Cantharellus anzutake]KAF8334867.1 hypothetical protein EI90DRAFT_370323 [Cantharellus anzutake]